MYAGFVHLHAIGRNLDLRIESIKSIIGTLHTHQPGGSSHVEEYKEELPSRKQSVTDEEPKMSDNEMNETIEQLCQSKAEEFHLIGYDQVTGADVWECVSDKYHKKGTPPLYEVVNDILSLKVTQFMNFITLSMYRGEIRK